MESRLVDRLEVLAGPDLSSSAENRLLPQQCQVKLTGAPCVGEAGGVEHAAVERGGFELGTVAPQEAGPGLVPAELDELLRQRARSSVRAPRRTCSGKSSRSARAPAPPKSAGVR